MSMQKTAFFELVQQICQITGIAHSSQFVIRRSHLTKLCLNFDSILLESVGGNECGSGLWGDVSGHGRTEQVRVATVCTVQV